jgi:xanthine dehydrogenase accessory factor
MPEDDSCAVAHGEVPSHLQTRTLVTVFDTPVAGFLIRYGNDLGYRTVLVEPERARISNDEAAEVSTSIPALGETTDVVVTDHHRVELAPMLRDALAHPARWIGVMGNPRHPAPYLEALADLGVATPDIERIHRPIGLNIGSKTPPEIAIATLAGLLADRNGRDGGFHFT